MKQRSYVLSLLLLLMFTIALICGGCSDEPGTNQQTESTQTASSTLPVPEMPDSGDLVIEIIDNTEKIIGAQNHTITACIRVGAIIDDGRVITSDESIYNAKDWEDIISIDAGDDYIVGINSNNELFALSRYDWYKSYDEPGKVIMASAGYKFYVCLMNDGTVHAYGHNGDGQCNTSDWENVRLIDAGGRHTIGITNDNEILLTGHVSSSMRNQSYDVPNVDRIVQVSAGGGYDRGNGHNVFLYNDGTVRATGDNTYGQCNVMDWTGIIAISAGDWHTLGLKEDGTVVSTSPHNPPEGWYNGCTAVDDWSNIVEISAGYGLSMAKSVDGNILCLGYNQPYDQKNAILSLNSVK